MIKKGIKFFGIIIMFIFIINIFETFCVKSYARLEPGIPDRDPTPSIWDDGGDDHTGPGDGGDVTYDPDWWEPNALGSTTVFAGKVDTIVGVVRIIGIIASVITLSIIGIKFMVGSVEERANYKQTLMPWLIGAILVFAITTVPTLIYEVVKG